MLQASLYFVVLEGVTVFAWFALVVHVKTIINVLVSAVNMERVTVVGQNVVTGINVLFVVLFLLWIFWFAYMAHSLTQETVYQVLSPNQIRRM